MFHADGGGVGLPGLEYGTLPDVLQVLTGSFGALQNFLNGPDYYTTGVMVSISLIG